MQYVYLLREREFIDKDEPVYTIGRSKQPNFDRFKQYPKGSDLLLQSACNDCKSVEDEIKKIFKKKYVQRRDIGIEYFEGDINEMIIDIPLIINKGNFNTIKNNTNKNQNNSTSNKIHKCKKCNKNFSNGYNLRRHQYICGTGGSKTNKQNRFKCSYCGNLFSRKDALTSHINMGRCKKYKVQAKTQSKTQSKLQSTTQSKIQKNIKKNNTSDLKINKSNCKKANINITKKSNNNNNNTINLILLTKDGIKDIDHENLVDIFNSDDNIIEKLLLSTTTSLKKIREKNTK